jgi:thioredoxin
MTTIHLTAKEFREKVFDYATKQDWEYQGNLPAIIDFYANWCGPCKMVAPVLEELAREYNGKLVIYKVDTDIEQELAFAFNIQSVPTMLFIDADGKAMMQPSAFLNMLKI